MLPAATGGNGSLTYALTPALPAGLTFTTSTRTISGTPTAVQAATTYTYKVTDADGNTADSDADTLTFTIAVVADTVPDFGTETVSNQNYTQNTGITSLTLPSATGGNGALTYALTPALPAGLTFTATTRTISGTPTSAQTAVTYTYKVTDADANTADSDADTLTFTITVVAGDTAPSFGGATVANQSYTQNTAITDLTLPSATGGNGTRTYALTPALPAGLTFTATTRTISGTPTATQAATTYTYKVTDADGNTADSDADTLTFTIAVASDTAPDTAPDFGTATVANQSYTQYNMITSLTLPSATGGNGALSYAITPNLPAGLTFTASTRTISGTPTTDQAATTYTYKVTDTDGNTADSDADTLTFTIAVAAGDTAPSFGTATVSNQSYMQNSVITSLTLPSATGGNGARTYALTPALPAGLTFAATTRTISGTPTAAQAATTYTYKVTDADGNTADSDADTLTFTIAVAAGDTAPSFGTATVSNQSYTQNTVITSLTLPSATGGNGVLTYALTPALPAGLTFTATTRTISGTPTAAQAATTYTYKVTDADGNTADSDADTLTFTIAVAAGDTAPSFGTVTVSNQTYTQNTVITSLTLPSATGGNGVLTYALTPALPAGLTFAASTQTISGTPTAAQTAVTYTYKVTDADANTADSDADTITFTIEVAMREVQPEVQRDVVKGTVAAVAARTVAGALDTIGARLGDAASSASLTIAGETLPLGMSGMADAWRDDAACTSDEFRQAGFDNSFGNGAWGCVRLQRRNVDTDALLSTSAFTLTLGAASGDREDKPGFDTGVTQWSAWGRGDLGSFEGRPEPGTRYRGETKTGWFGVDARGPIHGSKDSRNWVAGLAVSHGTSESDYSIDGGDLGEGGRLETELNAFWPYGRWTFENGLELHGMAGAGSGRLRHMQGDGVPSESSELTMRAASFGIRLTLPPLAGIALSTRSDASFARMETGKGEQTIDGLRADSWRVRTGLEASRRFDIKGDRVVYTFPGAGSAQGRWRRPDRDRAGAGWRAALRRTWRCGRAARPLAGDAHKKGHRGRVV